MKTNWGKKKIADVEADLPMAVITFTEFGIRPCCDANRVLGEIIEEQDLSEEDILDALDEMKTHSKESERDMDDDEFKALKPGEKADYILYHHHAYLWKTMPRVHALLLAVLRQHSEKHEELKEIHELCCKLVSDVEEHLIDEETNLFPALKKGGKSKKDWGPEVRHLMKEHDQTEKLFKKIRKSANDYKVPKDACDNYRLLYETLPQMEEDTLQHYHLENDILFPEITDGDSKDK